MTRDQITQAKGGGGGTLELGSSSVFLSQQQVTASKSQLPLRQSKKEDSIKDKLLAHQWQSLTLQEPDDTTVTKTDSFILSRFEPKVRNQVSKKIKKAYAILS